MWRIVDFARPYPLSPLRPSAIRCCSRQEKTRGWAWSGLRAGGAAGWRRPICAPVGAGGVGRRGGDAGLSALVAGREAGGPRDRAGGVTVCSLSGDGRGALFALRRFRPGGRSVGPRSVRAVRRHRAVSAQAEEGRISLSLLSWHRLQGVASVQQGVSRLRGKRFRALRGVRRHG